MFQSRPIFRYLDHPEVWLEMSEADRARAAAELEREFAERRVRYVIVYPRFMSERDLAGARTALERLGPEATVADDGKHLVYRLAPWNGSGEGE